MVPCTLCAFKLRMRGKLVLFDLATRLFLFLRFSPGYAVLVEKAGHFLEKAGHFRKMPGYFSIGQVLVV